MVITNKKHDKLTHTINIFIRSLYASSSREISVVTCWDS